MEEKLEFLERTQALTATPLFGADGKTDLWDVTLGEAAWSHCEGCIDDDD